MAFLVYSTTASKAFFDIMAAVCDATLRIILYADELVPGNRNRPDGSREFWAIYWAGAEWPHWLLARTGALPIFGVLRTKVVQDMPGRFSQLLKMILLIFFPEHAGMQDGTVLTYSDGRSVYAKFSFGGFLADEKALKQGCDSKGASGTLTCSFCANCMSMKNKRFLEDGLVCTDCFDCTAFKTNTHERIWQIANDPANIDDKDELQVMQQELGFNFNPDGVLAHKPLRAIVSPREHFLRYSTDVAHVEV